MDAAMAGTRFQALDAYMRAGLVGRAAVVERLLIGLLSGGHLLLEGAPGLAKTRAVKLLAGGLSTPFSRIQCTPDLMPADLTGTPVFRQDSGTFEFVKGPVFASLVLVDEINRAPPKVQSALLEAMGEQQVTSGGKTYALPDPFMVVATQNPIEHEGTFPLPEAQLDRFLLHVLIDAPDVADERLILELFEREFVTEPAPIEHSLSAENVVSARREAMSVHLSVALKDYIIRIVTATRRDGGVPEIADMVEHPVSPRGTLALASAAKSRAYLRGRDFALPEDVSVLAADALAHRVVLKWRAAADGETARGLIAKILQMVEPL